MASMRMTFSSEREEALPEYSVFLFRSRWTPGIMNLWYRVLSSWAAKTVQCGRTGRIQ
jgi:hypothetical protein